MSNPFVFYVDGAFMPESQAVVPVTDRGFVYGDGCFESIGVWQGGIVHLDDHVSRLGRSAAMLEIELPLSLDEVRDVLLETARQNAMAELQNAYLRIVVTRGTGPMGVSSVRDTTRPTVVVLAKDASGGDPRHPSPRSAVLCSYIRHPATLDPRIKSLNYLVSVMAYIEAERHGADIGVIRDAAGFVAEGHVMNLFCIRGGMVCTPAEGTSLAGITRGHVLQIAHEHGYACEERALTPYDFVTADEVFGTSASAGMFPISSFEGASFPAPGPITKALTGAYVDHALATATPVMPRIALQ